MIKIQAVYEENRDIFEYLEKRQLVGQYKKAKEKILSWNFRELSVRQPKKEWVWYFRINDQFRAFAKLEKNTLIVFDIYNHQNG